MAGIPKHSRGSSDKEVRGVSENMNLSGDSLITAFSFLLARKKDGRVRQQDTDWLGMH